MYKSPIELLVTNIYDQIQKEQDEHIYHAVLQYVPNVDREELIRALQYDRDQYNAGYKDGKSDAMRWIPVSERVPQKGETAIALGSRGGVYVAQYKGSTYWHKLNARCHMCEPTHWMPLPNPPEVIE